MTKKTKITAYAISFVMVLAAVLGPWSEVLSTTVQAADVDLTEHTGTSTGSGTGLTYNSTFTEDWEGGLDLNKWHVEKYKDSYVSDFQVVDDPLDGDGKVLTFTRKSTWLVPNNEYWPTAAGLSGDLKEITFRLYLKDAEALIPSGKDLTDTVEPGFVCAYTDPLNYDGWMFSTGIAGESYGLNANKSSRLDGVESTERISYWSTTQGYYAENFNFENWMNVKIIFSGSNYALSVTDDAGNSWTRSLSRNTVGGKFAIGNRLLSGMKNDQQTNGVMYIDDINVTFSRSVMDTDDVQKDVHVYYAGNTFLKPGDTLNLIGEQLGTTVKSAKIKKIDTDVSSNVSDAIYVGEDTYEYGAVASAAVEWEQIPAVEGTLIDDYEIAQRTHVGLKMVIPDGSVEGQEAYAEKGSYAVLLEAEADDGKDAIVIINNPQITLLMGDDGDYATSDGWLKLGGYNLSPKDAQDQVRAIIIKADGTRQEIANDKITIDTTENNGVSNDYYMKLDLENMAAGDYKLMVHNGYGGNYGWSMPYDFRVEKHAARELWADKGIFNVMQFGAVGDGYANDTAAIYRAIDAAVQNDGGTVYFPAAKDGGIACYRVTEPLIVGENISFVGDGLGKSMLMYCGLLEPVYVDYFISFEKNFEIRDMQISDQTVVFKNILTQNTDHGTAGKLYLDNVEFLSECRGAISGAVGTIMEGYTYQIIVAELSQIYAGAGQRFYYQEGGIENTFISVTDTEINIPFRVGSARHFFATADYINMEDLDLNQEPNNWSVISANKAGFFDGGSTSTLGSHMMIRNSGAAHKVTNNRELFLYDGGGAGVNVHLQPILDGNYGDEQVKTLLDDELEVMTSDIAKNELISKVKAYINNPNYKGRVYRFLDTKTKANAIMVSQGQGTGQMREIGNFETIGSYMYFTVESPFVVTPNRSSEITLVGSAPVKSFVNNCKFEDGLRVGPFSMACDVVFDKTVLRKATSGVTFELAYKNGTMWYCTAIRGDTREVGAAHTTYVDALAAGLRISDTTTAGYSNLGFRWSDNYTADGGVFKLADLGVSRKVTSSDSVVENNIFIGENPAMDIGTGSAMVGVWMKNNKQYTEEGNESSKISPYSSSYQKFIAGNKTQINGTLTHVCDEGDEFATDRQRGDVNNDHKISLKDITVIRYYLVEELTAEDLDTNYGKDTSTIYADVNEDEYIDMRDVYAIRGYLLTGSFGDVGTSKDPDAPDFNQDIQLDYSRTPEEAYSGSSAFDVDYDSVEAQD